MNKNISDKNTVEKQSFKSKTLAILIIAGLVVLTIYIIYKSFGPQFAEIYTMLKRGNQDEIGTYLNRQGMWKGMLSLYLISILQVVSVFIPGMAIQISGGLIYGWWRSFLVCYTGFVSGNVAVFYFARIIGNQILDLMGFNSNNWLSDKINNNDPGFIIAMACLIPGVPNGIIPYIAARTNITSKTFAEAIAASSWIQIICNCVAGHFLIRGEYLFMIICIAAQILIIVFATKKKERIMEIFTKLKRKKMKEVA